MKSRSLIFLLLSAIFLLFCATTCMTGGQWGGSYDGGLAEGGIGISAQGGIGRRETAPSGPMYTGSGGSEIRLAVLAPETQGDVPNYLPIYIQGVLNNNIKKFSAINLIDRQNLNRIIAEQNLAASGRFSERDFVSIGNLTNTQYFLFGNVQRLPGNRYSLQLSVTEASTGLRKANFMRDGAFAQFEGNAAILNEAVAELLEQLGVQLTAAGKRTLASNTSTALAEAGLARGITAQAGGAAEQALLSYAQAITFDPSQVEALSRLNNLSAGISGGTVSQRIVSDIQARDRWIEVFRETAKFFNDHPPFEVFFDPNLVQVGETNYARRTANLAMRIALDPSSAGFNAINTLLEGLEKTGRRRSWGLSNWPLTDITPRTAGTVLFNGRQTFSCRVDVRLLNENNKTISGGSITLNTEKIGFSQSGNALTIPRSVEGTVNFTNVKAEDLTPVLTIVIVAVNGIQADRINASGYMKVDTEDLEKRIRDREAAERERAAAAAQAERERAAAALAAAQWNVRGHSAWVYSVAFSPDGRQAISGSNDKTIKLWDVASGNLIRTFSGHSDAVFSVAFSPDGRQAISGSYDKTLKLWDVASGRVIRTFSGHTGYVRSVAFSPDGRQVISGSWDGRLKLWDIAGGSLIRTFSGHTDYVDSIAISPDGRQVISASYDGTLKLWDVVTGRLIRTFSHRHRNYGGYVIAFSPEEKQIILGSSDSLEMLDITSGSVIRIFSTYGICVAFSPDGRQVISNELKLWDVATGREIRTFWFSTFLVTSVAFSPDGKKVILGDETGYVRVWNVN